MNDIVLRKDNLPDTIEELQRFVLVGHERLKAYRAALSAINKLELAEEVRDQTRQDAQMVGEAVLWAESKLGQLLKEITKGKPKYDSHNGLTVSGHGSKKSLPEGITKYQSHEAQQLARNPELIEEVIDEAIEKKEIPTKRQVLEKIPKKKRKKRIDNYDIVSEDFIKAYDELSRQIEIAISNKFKQTSKTAITMRLETLLKITKG